MSAVLWACRPYGFESFDLMKFGAPLKFLSPFHFFLDLIFLRFDSSGITYYRSKRLRNVRRQTLIRRVYWSWWKNLLIMFLVVKVSTGMRLNGKQCFSRSNAYSC